jgi:hypothetical protein
MRIFDLREQEHDLIPTISSEAHTLYETRLLQEQYRGRYISMFILRLGGL